MDLAPDSLWERALLPALVAQNDSPEASGAPAPGAGGAAPAGGEAAPAGGGGAAPAGGGGAAPAGGEAAPAVDGAPAGGEAAGGAGAGADTQKPSFSPMFLMIGLMFLVFYFLMIRPERRRQKAHELLLKNLKKGDTVTTSAGIVGRIQRVEDKEVVVQVDKDSNTRIRFLKSAVADVQRPGAGGGAAGEKEKSAS